MVAARAARLPNLRQGDHDARQLNEPRDQYSFREKTILLHKTVFISP
jgi:hypothetical protein